MTSDESVSDVERKKIEKAIHDIGVAKDEINNYHAAMKISSARNRLEEVLEGHSADSAADHEKTPEEEWEEHNQSFQYEPPEGPPESWYAADYTELHDRLIGRRTEWYCQHCSAAPFSSLEKARSHVGTQHGDHLYEKYGGSDE